MRQCMPRPTLSTAVWQAVAMDVVNPKQIDTTLDDIGGCDRIKQDLVSFSHQEAAQQLPNRACSPASLPTNCWLGIW